MKNLFAATYTPTKKDGELNLSLIQGYAEFLEKNKVHGAFINGSTGDFVSLSTLERNLLLEEWAKNKSDLYLINHVGNTNLREAQEMAQHSQGKADAIAALAPFYFTPQDLNKLLDYCSSIAEKAPKLPFFYYHLPALTGVNFHMNDFISSAKKRMPNFAGVKFTENNVVEFQKVNATHADLQVFFGVDEGFLAGLSLGAKGWVGSTYNQLSPLYHAIKEAFENGDIQEANRLQGMGINFVEQLAYLGGFNGLGKSFMQLLGIDCGPSRYPHNTASKEELASVMKQFKSQGLEPYFSKI